MPEMAVETGKVSRLEQLRPEQGARRPGAAGPSGDRLPSCSPDDDPETISQSSPLRSRDLSECELMRWLQPAQAEPVAQVAWTTRARSAPVANRASRLE